MEPNMGMRSVPAALNNCRNLQAFIWFGLGRQKTKHGGEKQNKEMNQLREASYQPILFFSFGPNHDKLPELAHQKALEESLGIKDQSCPVLRFVPQDGVVADTTRSKDQLYLIPGNAVGIATPKGIPVCYRGTRQNGRLSK